jgi:biofilm PGA synthesis lipoprotein PgaB
MKPGEFLVLTYHAVPLNPSPQDAFSIPQKLFVEQMEYLRTHGYHPISLDDLMKAHEGKQALPTKPVLITFDDAYVSYCEFVVPILEKYGYPSVLAVVGSFIENPPDGLSEPLMTWDQLREVASKDLVDVVSHTYNLHKGIRYNPPGNIGPAVALRVYNPDTKAYETDSEYRARIERDFEIQNSLFTKYLGFTPRAIVWPYGWYTEISNDIAKSAGYRFFFNTEEGFADIDRLEEINRILIKNKPIRDFIKEIKEPNPEDPVIRAVQVDLDLIYDPTSYEQTDLNLGKLIDRLVSMRVNTVFLQAFSDPDGSGNIKSVYFYNKVLPVKADIFSHAVHQMVIRDMSVYAWLPTLSIELPDKELNENLKVLEFKDGKIQPSTSWYKRLTPFDSTVGVLVRSMYEDIAAHSLVHGILFQDDAYLTDHEDLHSSALLIYKEKFGKDLVPQELGQDQEFSHKLARYKTEVLIDFTKHLMEGVRKYRPHMFFARNLYARVLTDPRSEEWLAQNYKLSLDTYDYVVVMAYPQMDKVRNPSKWLKGLVKKAKEYPDSMQKTVFKVQAFDWEENKWLRDKTILEEIRDILASGGRHIAYYPDNVWEDKPVLKTIKLEMSTEGFPFLEWIKR